MCAFQNDRREWLETDGLGGFASGTVSGIRSRRYHALLLAATTPPTGRLVLINGMEVWVEFDGQRLDLASQHYEPDVIHPQGSERIESFRNDPWPQWTFQLGEGLAVRQELFCPHGHPAIAIRWSIVDQRPVRSNLPVALLMRPLMSGRDYHSLHHENGSFQFTGTVERDHIIWHPYSDLPAIFAQSNSQYHEDATWYRHFKYREEMERGLDSNEDLASPGVFRWDLSQEPAVWIAGALGIPGALTLDAMSAVQRFRTLEANELQRRGEFSTSLERAADQYIVTRYQNASELPVQQAANFERMDAGKTIIAGYPWFADWGRDAFIALRGLCIATGRLDIAGQILAAWSGVVSQGMLPNRFPDNGEHPEFNSVDASLWFIVAAFEYLQASDRLREQQPSSTSVGTVPGELIGLRREKIVRAIFEIVSGYIRGTRYGIRVDDDGLIFAGEDGVQLTWMDAKVGDWVVTPRIGKPVEIQALWLNAVWIASQLQDELTDSSQSSTNLPTLLELGRESFARRFWNASGGYLHDVVDVDFVPGNCDSSFRPNQIFAVGGLPLALVNGKMARCVVDAVEARLLTPLGLRSLDASHSDYKSVYRGDVWHRDGAYHQGTVWPWLLGPFTEAWLRVRKKSSANNREAIHRFIEPMIIHLDDHGLGHICEVADAASPHNPGGCPFQAWSLGELLRMKLFCARDIRPSHGTTPKQRDGDSAQVIRDRKVSKSPAK